MPSLNKIRVYLAGNMESVPDFISWRDEITIELKKLGIICLDPSKEVFINTLPESLDFRDKLIKMRESNTPGEFEMMQEYMKGIVQKDLRMVDLADFIICFLTPESPTFGTTHELINAAQDRKPILFILKDWRKIPLWLARYCRKPEIFPDIESLMSYLIGVHKNRIEVDSIRWKLLKPEFRG